MTSIAFPAPARPGIQQRHLAGLAVTLAVHLALIQAWQLTRRLQEAAPEQPQPVTQWLRLPELAPLPPAEPAIPERAVRPAPAAPARSVRPGPTSATAPSPAPAMAIPGPSPVTSDVPSSAAEQPRAAPMPSAAALLESARQSAGDIERTLRKERMPTIVAPPDSPEIRMRQGMEHARALAPNRLWEAPKVEELVNNTGDGARRTRVITGNGTYCITERSPVTSIDMIEKHGRQRITNCPQHEEPAKRQEWRTARD